MVALICVTVFTIRRQPLTAFPLPSKEDVHRNAGDDVTEAGGDGDVDHRHRRDGELQSDGQRSGHPADAEAEYHQGGDAGRHRRLLGHPQHHRRVRGGLSEFDENGRRPDDDFVDGRRQQHRVPGQRDDDARRRHRSRGYDNGDGDPDDASGELSADDDGVDDCAAFHRPAQMFDRKGSRVRSRNAQGVEIEEAHESKKT